MLLFTALVYDVEDLIPPIFLFAFLYFLLGTCWFVQWFHAASFHPFSRSWPLFTQGHFEQTPYLHHLVSMWVLSKVFVVFLTGLQLVQVHLVGSIHQLSFTHSMFISFLYTWIEAFEFLVAIVACKGWKITRSRLNNRDWLQTSILCSAIFLSALSVAILSKFYSVWIITLYILAQRLCFSALELNLNYMFSFLTPQGHLRFPHLLHPASIRVICEKKMFFFMLRMLMSAWLVVLAFREILFLTFESNQWADSPWFRIGLYESADLWFFVTLVYHLRYRRVVPLPSLNLESPISRTPVVPKVPLLFDFRPGPKPTSARPYLLVHLPTLECSSEGIPMHLGTKYDHKDFLEEISFLKTWTSKPSS